ncbi:unnamed protein product, partial [Leptidea sinapis]
MSLSIRFSSLILYLIVSCDASGTDIALDAKATLLHRIDSLNLLIYTCLLTLTVLTIWVFKHRRVSWLHETGLAVIYGLIVGAIIRYAGSTNELTYIDAHPDPGSKYNLSVPPDMKYFFRNLGAILTFAMVGTALSALVIGSLMYGCVQLMPASLATSFTFLDTLYFGALISPTDPLTVLAIFSQLKVDVNLAIQNYEKRYSVDGGFEITAFLAAIGDFIGIFSLSLLVGAFI